MRMVCDAKTVENSSGVEGEAIWVGCAEVLEAAPDSIVIVDDEGRIAYVNAQTERMFGYTRGEMLGVSLDIVVPAQIREQHARYCMGFRSHPRTRPMGVGLDLRGLRRDGSEFPVDISLSPIRTGDRTYIMSIIRDVTPRQRVEEALREARTRTEIALQRERRIAARFQGALLPRGEVEVPGYAVAHSHRPALAEADVGGDFYNLFAIDERHVGIIIGDVGGKGLEAAAEAARVQHSTMALAINARPCPGAVLDGVRRVVRAFEEPDRMVTIFFGILDLETGALRYAGAGHEPAFVWRAAERRVVTLMPTGVAILGVSLGPYTSRETLLEPDDLLFLYTDGLPDARRGTELLGYDRIARLLAEHHDQDPRAILDAMYEAAMEQSDGNLSDDIALVAVRRLPVAEAWARESAMLWEGTGASEGATAREGAMVWEGTEASEGAMASEGATGGRADLVAVECRAT